MLPMPSSAAYRSQHVLLDHQPKLLHVEYVAPLPHRPAPATSSKPASAHVHVFRGGSHEAVRGVRFPLQDQGG